MKKNLIPLLMLVSSVGFSQVGIGTDSPHESAILELNSDSKGLLITRINLNSETDQTTTSAPPAVGLLVWNKAELWGTTGFHYWDGSTWQRLVTENSVDSENITSADWDHDLRTLTLFKGDGSTQIINIPLIKTVNGNTPDSTGNVVIDLSNVTSGTLLDRPDSGNIDGDIYVVSNNTTDPQLDGLTFVWDEEADNGNGQWFEITSNYSNSDSRYLLLSGANSMQGDLNMTDHYIVNLKDPVNDQDAATKNYVDAQITASNSADGDTDSTNELNSDVTLSGTELVVTDAGGDKKVDLNTTFATDAELATEKADLQTNIDAVQADVDANETAANNAIAVVQADVDANETAANDAIAAVQADVDANETAANDAIALKEDAANKSTDGTLADNSDVDFPTEQAVKTYVDAQITASNSADGDTDSTNELNSDVTLSGTELVVTDAGGDKKVDLNTTFATDAELATEKADLQTNIDTVQADVDANETAANDAIAVVQADVDANETAANDAIALKEDAANKSTDGTLADNSDVDFPTEQAVKTYVDAQITASNSADGDTDSTNELNSDVTLSGTELVVTDAGGDKKVDLNTTFATDAELATEKADLQTNIDAVQADVDANETAVNDAIAAVQADVDANETAANNAIAAVQADVDANETAANNAIALKEDAANKSTDGTLADNSDVDFPTEQAVKTYVDAQITASNSADGDTDSTNELNSDVTLSGTELVVTDAGGDKKVDLNTTFATDAELATEKADLQTNIDAVQADVDANETAVNDAIAAVQADVDANETAANNAIAAVQADVDANETAANNAIALKEDAANKSTDGTLADNSDVDFPTEQAVKTYVDAQITASNSADGDTDSTNELNSDVTLSGTELVVTDAGGDKKVDLNTTFATDAELATEKADLQTNIDAVQADVDANETAANDAIAVVQADVDANETAANNAIALKEDAANKSTDGTLADNSDVDFPTEQAVKTYVDAQITASNSADGDTDSTNELNSDVTLSGTELVVTDAGGDKKVDLNTTFATDAELATEKADLQTNIDAVQADVDANETAANDAIAVVQADVDANETAANNAIAAVQADVDANETAANNAIALKEDAANKSTDGTLADNSDVDFPTEQAVKTYVDAQITASNSADGDTDSTNELNSDVTLSGTELVVTDAGGDKKVDLNTTFATDAELATEKADLQTNIDAVQADVDANETAANDAIAAVQADVDANETAANDAIAAVQADVDANETAANNAIALKEDAANKSTDGTLADNSDVDFPTEQAVKTYVDAQITASNSADGDTDSTNELNSDVTLSGTELVVTDAGGDKKVDLNTTFATDAELATEKADLQTNIDTVQADVDANETAANNAIAVVQADVDANETAANDAIAAVQADVDANETAANNAIALKEDAANKSTDGTLADNSDVDFPTEQAVKTYVDAQVSNTKNIYDDDGTLSGNRTVTGGGNDLTLTDIGTIQGSANNIQLAATSSIQIQSSGTTQISGTSGIELENNTTVSGDISVSGSYADSTGNTGTTGQVLSSTSTGTKWVDSAVLNTLSENYDTTGGQVISNSFVDINLGTDGIKDSDYSNSTNSITVNEAGRYRITYRISTKVPQSVNTRTGGEFHLHSSVDGVVAGTKSYTYQRNKIVDKNTVTVTKILDLDANETLKIQGKVYSSTGTGTITLETVANGSSLIVERIK